LKRHGFLDCRLYSYFFFIIGFDGYAFANTHVKSLRNWLFWILADFHAWGQAVGSDARKFID
jgi:hypothetical protein